ncbi:hypothetical protein SUGI_1001590 [Cryptomeria japonica]|nr:hypothetical protein SUGI_1001590 [Cryptomeria japonica]
MEQYERQMNRLFGIPDSQNNEDPKKIIAQDPHTPDRNPEVGNDRNSPDLKVQNPGVTHSVKSGEHENPKPQREWKSRILQSRRPRSMQSPKYEAKTIRAKLNLNPYVQRSR